MKRVLERIRDVNLEVETETNKTWLLRFEVLLYLDITISPVLLIFLDANRKTFNSKLCKKFSVVFQPNVIEFLLKSDNLMKRLRYHRRKSLVPI